MIKITIKPAELFAYDIQSLVQAFYPGHPFKVNREVESFYRELIVRYGDEEIVVKLNSEEKNLFKEHIVWDCKGFLKDYFEIKAQKSVSDKKSTPDKTYRSKTKNILKKLIYKLLAKDTGITLPWGNLTGIRPAKIPAMLMEEGLSDNEIKEIMKGTYLISDEKMNLAMEIAKKERELLKDINYRDGYSLYVGIPFCPTTCLYCSFTSFPIKRYEEKVDQYIDTLIKELQFLGQKLKGRELNTVYIGGGTPTTLQPDQLHRLICALKDKFDFSTVREFTVEAGRPDSITKEKLEVLKEDAVTRISINPQTMHQKTLDLIGRKHTIKQVIDAFHLARDCGIDNINMDFIVGLPNEDEVMLRESMEEVMKLNPESLTIHSLAVKRAARLSMNPEKYANLQMNNNSTLMDITRQYAEKLDMRPYYLYRQKNMAGNQENVGYAKHGFECLYNVLMMGDYQDVWAVGAGAVTKLLSKDRKEGTRIDTLKNVDEYIGRIDEMIERKEKYLK